MITGPVVFQHFTGRDRELGQLRDLWSRAARESVGAAAILTGEAGVGKSRLLHEFRDSIARKRGLVVATACDESVQFAYAPVIDLIDALIKRRVVRDSLDLAAARRRLTDPLPPSGPHASALAQRYTSVVDALADVAARAGALALIIDDLQWSDASSLDLLRYLVRESTAAPLLLVLAYRSEDADDTRFAGAVARIERERVYRIRVAPLDDSSIRSAIETTVGHGSTLAPETIERISELAEGKPYFAEELLRSALEQSAGAPASGLAAPTSLRAAVLQRVDALDPRDRDVLAHAAVVGRTFSAALLGRILGCDATTIFRALRAARNAQIVRETPAGAYEFRHALTREILYGEFLVAESRALHVRIADELANDDARASLLAEIAHHRWLGRDGERSAAANEAAGDEAARLSAYADAWRFFARALETVEPLTLRRAALSEKAAHAAIMIGDVDGARTETEAAIAALRATGDARNRRRLTLWSARQSHLRGDHAAALAVIAAVKAELESDPADDANRIAADIAYASLVVSRGGAAQALETADRLLERGCELSNDDAYHVYHARGTARVRLGRYDEAIEDYETAERLAARVDNAYGALYSANNRAAAAGFAGRYEVARSAYEAALARAAATGIEHTTSLLSANAAFWELLLGDLQAACTNAAGAITRRASDHAVGLAMAVQVRLATLAGDHSRAAFERVATTLQRAATLDDAIIACIAGGAAALDHLACGRDAEARAIVAQTIERAQEFVPAVFWLAEATARAGSEDDRARMRLLLAAPCASADAAAGYAALFEALALGESGPRLARTDFARRAVAPFERSGLRYEVARALELAGDTERAGEMFRRIGASGETLRLERTRTNAAQTSVGSRVLTRREEQIARLAARGLSNRDIADDLRIGERTVETHVAHVYAKLRIRTRAELALYVASVDGDVASSSP